MRFDKSLLEKGRSRPLYDSELHRQLQTLLGEQINNEDYLYDSFIKTFDSWIQGSQQNKIIALEQFSKKYIIHGVTHSLDDLHIRFGDRLVFMPKEYLYHKRIKGNSRYAPYNEWRKGDVAVLSSPFSHTGCEHLEMKAILSHCEKEGIDVHIDAAWFGPNLNYSLDLSSPSIRSVSFSLSKSLGLGRHQCGLRYEKVGECSGPVHTINQFKHFHTSSLLVGLHMMNTFSIDYFINKYGNAYKEVIDELDLFPSQTLHVALANKGRCVEELIPVGVRGFLRQIVEGKFR